MATQPLLDIARELRRYTGFMTPEPLRTLSNTALSQINSHSRALTSPNSAVIDAYTSICQSPKLRKSISVLTSSIISAFGDSSLSRQAVSPFLNATEMILNELDDSSLHKLVKLCSEVAINSIIESHILQSSLSILVTLSNSPYSSVSSECIQSIKQIFIDLFALSTKNTEYTQRQIDLAYYSIVDLSIQFDSPILKVIYIIFRDICLLSTEESPLWLRVAPGKPFYSLLNTLIDTGLFNKFNELYQKVAMFKNTPPSLAASITNCLIEFNPSAASSTFSMYLGKLNDAGDATFFKTLFLKPGNTFLRFHNNCDKNVALLHSLFTSLNSVSNSTYPITLSLSEGSTSIESAPLELTVLFLQSMYRAETIHVKTMVNRVAADQLSIFSMNIPRVDEQSLYVVNQGLQIFVALAEELRLDDIRTAAIDLFVGLGDIASDAIAAAVEGSPGAFSGSWHKVLKLLNQVNWKPSSFEFTTTMKPQHVCEMCLALLSLPGKWGLGFLSNILLVNNSRFDSIWSVVEGYFLLLIDDKETEQYAFDTFLIIVESGFGKTSEKQICLTIEKLFTGRRRLSVTFRTMLLDVIRHSLVTKGMEVRGGWASLIDTLDPSNFKDEAVVLNYAFRCVQIICSDLMFQLDEELRGKVIELIFKYARQNIDINVSLSAFGLVWSALGQNTSDTIWEMVLMSLFDSIYDDRADVSLSAVKTVFSIIPASSKFLSESIKAILVQRCFIPMIQSVNSLVRQTCYYEMIHLTCTLYDVFSTVEGFIQTLIPDLIVRQSEFSISLNRPDDIVTSLQFYDEAFRITELPEDIRENLFESFKSVSSHLIQTQKPESIVFPFLGRVISNIIVSTKPLLNDDILKGWLEVIDKLYYDVNYGEFAPSSIHKTMPVLVQLFPLPLDMTSTVVSHFIKCALSRINSRFIEMAIQSIYEIVDTKVSFATRASLYLMCLPLFEMQEARRLLLLFVEGDIEIDDSDLNMVCDSLMKLGGSNSDLTEKTGACLIKLFPRLESDKKLEFIRTHGKCFPAMQNLWVTVCDPRSSTYNEASARVVMPHLLKQIGGLLSETDNENTLKDILLFIQDVESPDLEGESVVAKGKSHIILLMPYLADQILHPSIDIRKILRQMLQASSTLSI